MFCSDHQNISLSWKKKDLSRKKKFYLVQPEVIIFRRFCPRTPKVSGLSEVKKKSQKVKETENRQVFRQNRRIQPENIIFHPLFIISSGKAPPGKLAGALYNVWIEKGFRDQRKYFSDQSVYSPITFKIR